MGRCTCRGPAAAGTFTSGSVKLNPSSRDQRVGTLRQGLRARQDCCSTLSGLRASVALFPRGLHPGLICSTPPGWVHLQIEQLGISMLKRVRRGFGIFLWRLDYDRATQAVSRETAEGP